MKKSSSAFLSIFIAFVLVLGVLSYKENIYGQTTAPLSSSTNSSSNSMGTMNMTNNASAGSGESSGTTVTRDSVTLLLEGHSLPKGEYIELYDATPSKIVDGHFVAKVPCNSKGQSEVDLLTGEAPNLKSTDAEFVKELSTPGNLCLYHVDLVSDAKNTITDVAIKNNSTKDISFPASSSVSVGVNSIAPLPSGQG
ncbi:MAG: hypothetical protein ACTHKJ_04855 [Candidatus Nitrosocosmicus sp.]